jgi:hypothetical protein
MKTSAYLIIIPFCALVTSSHVTASDTEVQMPPVVQNRIGVAQIFDYITGGRIQFSPSSPDFVWGTKTPIPNRFSTFYVAFDRDTDRNHSETWYRTTRPSWLAYKCDQKSLALSYKYDFGYYMPVDIGNLNARQYFWSEIIQPALAKGYQGVAFDNVASINYTGRCGTTEQGTWRQTFSGTRVDRNYANAVRDWLAWMRQRIHAVNKAVAINLFFSADDVERYERLADQTEIIF